MCKLVLFCSGEAGIHRFQCQVGWPRWYSRGKIVPQLHSAQQTTQYKQWFFVSICRFRIHPSRANFPHRNFNCFIQRLWKIVLLRFKPEKIWGRRVGTNDWHRWGGSPVPSSLSIQYPQPRLYTIAGGTTSATLPYPCRPRAQPPSCWAGRTAQCFLPPQGRRLR
jgi:hypothetical protein